MNPPPRYITKIDPDFHPPEADRIAEIIHAFLEKLTGEYLALKTDFEKGTSNWLGHRKEVFVNQAQPRIPKLASFVEYLRSRERHYRSITVVKTEQIINPDWEAYQNKC